MLTQRMSNWWCRRKPSSFTLAIASTWRCQLCINRDQKRYVRTSCRQDGLKRDDDYVINDIAFLLRQCCNHFFFFRHVMGKLAKRLISIWNWKIVIDTIFIFDKLWRLPVSDDDDNGRIATFFIRLRLSFDDQFVMLRNWLIWFVDHANQPKNCCATESVNWAWSKFDDDDDACGNGRHSITWVSSSLFLTSFYIYQIVYHSLIFSSPSLSLYFSSHL